MHAPVGGGKARASHLLRTNRMSDLIMHFLGDEGGATATEYALLIVFVAAAIAGGANVLGQGISNLFSTIGTYISSLNPVLPPVP